MVDHKDLRKLCKLACVCSDGEIKLKDLAGVIDITEHSFYNYINGYYNISKKKADILLSFVIEWVDVE